MRFETGARTCIALVALVNSLAACSAPYDRDLEAGAVYNAVVLGLLDGQVQLHDDPAGHSIAIANKTYPDRILEPDSGPWTLDKLNAELPKAHRAALADYVKRRWTNVPVRDTFRVPHEMVTADALTDADRAMLFERGGLVQLSPVGFDSRGQVAVLYVVHTCAFGGCATGHFICLNKESGGWVITKAILAVIA